MATGKARIARTRRVDRSRFDDRLIDDYQIGQPPDPREQRAIPIVYGATRLASEPRDRIASTNGELSQWPLFDPNLDESFVAPTINIAPTVVANPAPPTAKLVALLNEQANKLAAPPIEKPNPPVEPPHVHGAVAQTAPSPEAWTGPTPVPLDIPVPERFELRRFMLGITTGGIAGAILLAVLSLI